MTGATAHIIRLKTCSAFIALLFATTFVPYGKIHAQHASEYQVKAAFLFNFTRFLEWPPESFNNYKGPFVVGVYGRNPFGNFLSETVAGEEAFGRPIVVRHFGNLKDMGPCHILFIGPDVKTEEVLHIVSGKPVLTVSDDPDFCRKGGVVRFFSENDMIRLEINTDAAKFANLNVSSKLLGISKICNNTR